MSAKKDLYLAVKETLLKKTEIKHVRLFNNQFQNMNKEDTFPFPCTFVEFLELDWETETQGLQNGDVTIRLHNGFETLETEDLSKFDIIDDQIHKHIEGLSGEVFSRLSRINEQQDVDHDNVYVWIMDYKTNLSDDSAVRQRKMVLTKLEGVNIDVCEDQESTKPRLRHKN